MNLLQGKCCRVWGLAFLLSIALAQLGSAAEVAGAAANRGCGKTLARVLDVLYVSKQA